MENKYFKVYDTLIDEYSVEIFSGKRFYSIDNLCKTALIELVDFLNYIGYEDRTDCDWED